MTFPEEEQDLLLGLTQSMVRFEGLLFVQRLLAAVQSSIHLTFLIRQRREDMEDMIDNLAV